MTIKIILPALMILFSINVKAQTTAELDKKNGFKEIKLGTTFESLKSNLELSNTFSSSVKRYKFTGDCCQTIFEYNVDEIHLLFSNDSLVMIFIYLEQFQKPYSESNKNTNWENTNFESIKKSFSLLFGQPSSTDMDDNTGNVIYNWIGENVSLISKYEYLGLKAGDRQTITVLMNDFIKTSGKKRAEEGF